VVPQIVAICDRFVEVASPDPRTVVPTVGAIWLLVRKHVFQKVAQQLNGR
jgi:hypothetical protein